MAEAEPERIEAREAPRDPELVAVASAAPALASAIGNRAIARLAASGDADASRALARSLGRTNVRTLARQPPDAPAAQPTGQSAPAAAALSSAATAALAEVRAAMAYAMNDVDGEVGGGVGDFPRAFRALAPLSVDDLIAVLRELARTHEDSVLAGHISEAAAGDQPRLRVALEAAILLEEPAQNLTESSVSSAATALANADPALREQILRAMMAARQGLPATAMAAEGLALLMASANLPTLNPGLAGVRGPVTPGAWAPPGGQPIPFYLGTAAHLAIAAEYAIQNPGDTVRTNTVSIARILTDLAGAAFGLKPNRAALDAERLGSEPDIANLTKRHIYEIKPAGQAALALSEAQWYVESFTLAGVPMALGPAGAPGTTGVVPAPGGVYLFESPQAGVILYQLRRMQVEQVTVPEGSGVQLPRFRLAPLTQQQQQQAVVATMTVGTIGIILLMILGSPVGV